MVWANWGGKKGTHLADVGGVFFPIAGEGDGGHGGQDFGDVGDGIRDGGDRAA